MKASNAKYISNQRRILNYFSSVRLLFQKGNIRFKTSQKWLDLSYHQANFQGWIIVETSIPYKKSTNEEKKETIRLVQDFIISCYYEFERDWLPMKLKDLARLSGVWISSIDESLKKTLEKFKIHLLPKC